jgi:hypothetical protein
VRQRRPLSGIGLADLRYHDCLAERRGSTGEPAQPPGVLQLLDEQQKNRCLGVVEQVVDTIKHVDVDLIACRDDVPASRPPAMEIVEERETESAALRYHGHRSHSLRPALAFEERAETGTDRAPQVHEADGVGPGDGNASGRGCLLQLSGQRRGTGVLGEAVGENDRSPGAGGCALAEDSGYGGSAGGDHREVDGQADCSDVLVRGQSAYWLARAADRVNLTQVSVLPQVADETAAWFCEVLRCSDHSDTRWLKERGQAMRHSRSPTGLELRPC